MPDSPAIRSLIALAIKEDMPRGDITTELTIDGESRCEAVFLVKEDCVACGVGLLPVIYSEFGYSVSVAPEFKDGDWVRAGEILASVSGSTREILSSERICLNFLQHLSGIATGAHRIVQASPGMKILDTRKTTPGLRELEKYAVRTGGASNHRASLSDLIMVKNNHVDANPGGMEAVLEKIYASRPEGIAVEVEVRNRKELETALKFKPDIIMLDNMDNSEIGESLRIISAQSPLTQTEVSGGITAERLKSLKEIGVTMVSMGALTNRAGSIDISLRFTKYF